MAKILFRLIKGCSTCPYHDDNDTGIFCNLIKETMPKDIEDTFIHKDCGIDEITNAQIAKDEAEGKESPTMP